jgi:dephospho-CoA kinase
LYLNTIVHPEVKKHFKIFVENNLDKAYIIYENAILFESKSNLFCDFIISVYADINTRIKRVTARDIATKEEVFNRIQSQWNDDKKILQSNYIISNEYLDETKKKVQTIHNILTEKIRSV